MRIRKSTRHEAMTLRRSFEKSFLMTERASRIISPLPRLLKLLKLRWCEVRWLGQTQIYAELGHPAEQFLRIVSATCGCSRRRSPTPCAGASKQSTIPKGESWHREAPTLRW